MQAEPIEICEIYVRLKKNRGGFNVVIASSYLSVEPAGNARTKNVAGVFCLVEGMALRLSGEFA